MDKEISKPFIPIREAGRPLSIATVVLACLVFLSSVNAIPIDQNTDLTCVGNVCSRVIYQSPQFALNDSGQWDWISNQVNTNWNAQQAVQQFSNGRKNVTMWIQIDNGNYYTLKQAYNQFGFQFQPVKTQYKNGWKWGVNFTFTPAQGSHLRKIGFTSNGGQTLERKWCYEVGDRYKPCLDLTDMYGDPNTLVLVDNETDFIINQTTWASGWAWIDPTVTINSSNTASTWSYGVTNTGGWNQIFKNANVIPIGRDFTVLDTCGAVGNANFICEGGLNFNVTNALPLGAVVTHIDLFQGYSSAYAVGNVNFTYVAYTNQSIQPWFNTNGSNFYDYWLIQNTTANLTLYQQWAQLNPPLNFTVTLSNGSDAEAARFNNSEFFGTNYTLGIYLWNASSGSAKTRTYLSGKTAGNCPYLNVSYEIPSLNVTLNDPLDSSIQFAGNVTFTATANTVFNISNWTVYSNFSGAWSTNVTQVGNANLSQVIALPPGVYVWNALACDTNGLCAFDSSNHTFTVVIPNVNLPMNNEFWTLLPFVILALIATAAFTVTREPVIGVFATLLVLMLGFQLLNGFNEVYPGGQTANTSACITQVNQSFFGAYNITNTSQVCSYAVNNASYVLRYHGDAYILGLAWTIIGLGALLGVMSLLAWLAKT